MTEEVEDAAGMMPPVISLKLTENVTIYCDDPNIDDIYDGHDSMSDQITERLTPLLTNITIDEIWKSCTKNIQHIARAFCNPHPTVCHATTCRFERYIIDGCKQKSNQVEESILILPRKPYFVSFPDNERVSCDEEANVTGLHTLPDRFKQPVINPGCRNADFVYFYEDKFDTTSKCAEKIYR